MFFGLLYPLNPPFCVIDATVESSESPFRVYVGAAVPTEKSPARVGSWTTLTPNLKSWLPCQSAEYVMSSLNWYFACRVVCGVFGFWPERTPLAK